MDWVKFTKNILLGAAYLLALGPVVLYLFFPKEFFTVSSQISHVIGLSNQVPAAGKEENEIRIGLVRYPNSLEPTSLDYSTRTLALQVYEPLVRMDRYLKVEPALAISWGRISPTVWQFELRPRVIFHDNRPLTVDDVVASFRRAAQYKNSDLKSTVRGLAIEPQSATVFQIRSEQPDPMLLEKVSSVLIFPKEHETRTVLSPVGTGSYEYVSTKPNTSFTFQAFSSYWDGKPVYKKATFHFYSRRDDREHALAGGDVDIITDVSPESIKKLRDQSLRLDILPSLEVNFLTFNFQGVFKDARLRKAVRHALDKKTFVDFAFGYASAVNQYVSSGVFGFNPRISASSLFDPEKASAYVKQVSSFDLIPIRMEFVQGLETAGEYIRTQLRSVGFDPKVRYLSWSDFRESLSDNDADMYFFGWKSDLGSVADFYVNAVHTRDIARGIGAFNAGGFSDSGVDTLINQGSREFDERKRLRIFQEVMRMLVDADYGVPLFESQVIYASSESVRFQPRFDGYILAADIR